MTVTPRVPKAELTGLQGQLLKFVVRRRAGRVPESLEVLWNHPRVLKDIARMGGRSEKWDRLDETLGAFAVMASAAQIGCGFCLDLNYYVAHTKGLAVEKAREVPRWRESAAFTPLERRVMEYAEAMSATPPTVTDEMSAALLADLGAAGLIELTAKIAYMNLAARSNVALGISSEHFADACGLRPLTSRPPEVSSA